MSLAVIGSSPVSFSPHEGHADKSEAVGARERLGEPGRVVKAGHVRLDAHLGVRSKRSLTVAAED